MTVTDDGGVVYWITRTTSDLSSIVTCSLPEGDCETQLSDLNLTTLRGNTVTYGGAFFANQRHQ